jgi:hypothetical protein
MTPLIEQEIYLLERYSSLEYFELMRDAFKAMAKTGQAALDKLMHHSPRSYRELWAVWAKRMICNLGAGEFLDEAYEKLAGSDYTALQVAAGMRGALTGLTIDYGNEWMAEEFQREFDAQRHIVSRAREGIESTYFTSWGHEAMYYPTWAEEKKHWHVYWEFLPPPETWPIYRLNPDVQVNTTEIVKQTGIYLPEIGNSCPAILVAGEKAVSAKVGLRGMPRTRQATLWTLIERVADEGGPIPGQEPWREHAPPTRVKSGQPCPREGYWCSPANRSTPLIFKKGEIMPIVTSTEFAQNYWQWSRNVEEK